MKCQHYSSNYAESYSCYTDHQKYKRQENYVACKSIPYLAHWACKTIWWHFCSVDHGEKMRVHYVPQGISLHIAKAAERNSWSWRWREYISTHLNDFNDSVIYYTEFKYILLRLDTCLCVYVKMNFNIRQFCFCFFVRLPLISVM